MRTINDLLFTQGNQVMTFECILALNDSSRAEGPTASALALIFDWGDNTFSTISLSSPIPSSWKSIQLFLSVVEDLCDPF